MTLKLEEIAGSGVLCVGEGPVSKKKKKNLTENAASGGGALTKWHSVAVET